MKLINKYEKNKNVKLSEYFCEITDELDRLSRIETTFYMLKHYILVDEYCIKEKRLAIRIPGGTIGEICLDDNNIITKIKIDINYIVKTYPENIEEIMKKFIGVCVEF